MAIDEINSIAVEPTPTCSGASNIMMEKITGDDDLPGPSVRVQTRGQHNYILRPRLHVTSINAAFSFLAQNPAKKTGAPPPPKRTTDHERLWKRGDAALVLFENYPLWDQAKDIKSFEDPSIRQTAREAAK
ncbi:uncharacterized protein LOC131675455 isoform X2 [Phymastichus coffea]|uniref:uncharacterized protein LOC131675455 isoform X2 n=1 Tax=Phymastichus coffea TaxID=108790 RepID=UPI00273A918B|nr:uncharacterized protein LOC131675455 isoform X2 [Phymastichus coffea]